MNDAYKKRVELLLRIMPVVADEDVFAVHGGSAINLFLLDMPRYSVDIDLTYVPLEDRQTSLEGINAALSRISQRLRKMFAGMNVTHRPDVCKLLCRYQSMLIKIEVNQTKRGVVCGDVQQLPLCGKAQEEFGLYCEARVVPTPLLYGGKIAAALSRQHPRDLFDIWRMQYQLEQAKEGLIFCLLGSDRPIYESFAPNLTDQHEAMENQFAGMTDVPFTYDMFEQTRQDLVRRVNAMMDENDRKFLISFESAAPDWSLVPYSNFAEYPSVKWKLLNLEKLAKSDCAKLNGGVARLRCLFE